MKDLSADSATEEAHLDKPEHESLLARGIDLIQRPTSVVATGAPLRLALDRVAGYRYYLTPLAAASSAYCPRSWNRHQRRGSPQTPLFELATFMPPSASPNLLFVGGNTISIRPPCFSLAFALIFGFTRSGSGICVHVFSSCFFCSVLRYMLPHPIVVA
ncbi:hypothetical protein BD779DRAFT_1559263 [Infundibulicybe gibba]|nr:hypothetical protein BD779DRAFT_1559263 [Infundibulicybe gibba]